MTIQTLRDVDNSPILHSSWSLTISDIVIVSNFKSAYNCPQHSAAPKIVMTKNMCKESWVEKEKALKKIQQKKRKPQKPTKKTLTPLKTQKPQVGCLFL